MYDRYLCSSPCRSKWLNPCSSGCGCHFNSMLLSGVTTCLWHTVGESLQQISDNNWVNYVHLSSPIANLKRKNTDASALAFNNDRNATLGSHHSILSVSECNNDNTKRGRGFLQGLAKSSIITLWWKLLPYKEAWLTPNDNFTHSFVCMQHSTNNLHPKSVSVGSGSICTLLTPNLKS